MEVCGTAYTICFKRAMADHDHDDIKADFFVFFEEIDDISESPTQILIPGHDVTRFDLMQLDAS